MTPIFDLYATGRRGMGVRTGEYIEAAQAFAEAGVDPDAWPAALRRLESATGSKGGQLIGIGSSGLLFDIADLPDYRFTEFAEVEGHSPLVNPRVAAAARARPMQVVGDVEYDEVMPLLRSDVYLEWLSRRRMADPAIAPPTAEQSPSDIRLVHPGTAVIYHLV